MYVHTYMVIKLQNLIKFTSSTLDCMLW